MMRVLARLWKLLRGIRSEADTYDAMAAAHGDVPHPADFILRNADKVQRHV